MTSADNNPCRLCGGESWQIILHDILTRQKDRFALRKCDDCDLVTTYPIPSEEKLQHYYNQDYWQSSQTDSRSSFDTLYRFRMASIVTAIRKYANEQHKILDWGCGDGSFINLLRTYGFDSYGIDAYKKSQNDNQIFSTVIEKADFPKEYFDIITCFHVLEHLVDPLTSVKHALMLLKTGGLIIIEVPNLASLGYRIFKDHWQPLEIPTHLNHFTPSTLQKVIETAGKIQIVKTEFFSHRISPSALVLSLFPSLAPRIIRKKHNGRYPAVFLGSYLLMQLAAYPFALLGSLAGHGEIVRMYFRKAG